MTEQRSVLVVDVGGNNVKCMNAADSGSGWNWAFWNGVLKGLVQEVNAASPLAPARLEATHTTSIPSRPWSLSKIACRLDPSPETMTATRKLTRRLRRAAP